MMTTNKLGVLLRNGKAQGFQPLDVDGQPVHSAALPLREMVRLKLGADAAQCLALLQTDESGTRFDWYASSVGTVTTWAAASPAARGAALAQLETLHAQLIDAAQHMENDGKPEQQAMARLLRKAIYFPGSDYVYLVDGKPVITFWGFAVSGADTLDPLRYLRLLPNTPPAPMTSLAPMPAAPIVPGVVAAAPSRWRWLPWLILLLLLLLLAFFLLRAYTPHIRLPWDASHAIDAPKVEEPAEEIAPPPQESPEEPEPDNVKLPLSLDFFNGRWVGPEDAFEYTETRNGKTVKKEAFGLDYVFQNGTGTARALRKNTPFCEGPVTISIEEESKLKISEATLHRCYDESVPHKGWTCVIQETNPDELSCLHVVDKKVSLINLHRQKN